MTLIRVIRSVAASVAMTVSVNAAVTSAERDYSPLIAYPTRRFIESEPSLEFARFLRRAVLFDLSDQIVAVSKLLKISLAVILSYLERTLLASNWSIAEETERLKDDWEYHARDKCVVWIVPRFHVQIWELLHKFVHQTVENGRYTATTLQALENILRIGDPTYVATLPQVKPNDIPALPTVDGAIWVEELNTPVGTAIEVLPRDGWTTVHEQRLQSQTNGHHPLLVSAGRVRSLLVTPALANRLESLPSPDEWSDDIPYLHEDERLTIGEGQRRLKERGSSLDLNAPVLPVVSAHENGISFQGFRMLTFIHPTWLTRYNLVFEGTEVLSKGECVARLEEWQEGYQDEPYSRDLLSAGMRFIIRNDWLQMLLNDAERTLILHTEETREWYKDFWEKTPTSKSSRGIVACYVHSL